MPGTRLSYEERQGVAAGLASGLSYAEIARRLGRPRSTVIREVARNGGAHGYRANRAQQATQWRARRRTAAAPPDAPPSTPDPQACREFEARFARMATQTGVPAMMARVLVCLFTTESGSLTAAELVARLRVSPASVSKAVAWLEQRGLLRRERDGRRERYVVDDHVWHQAWLASMDGMARWAEVTRQGAELLGGDTPAGARLHATSQWLRHVRDDMVEAAEHWRHALPGKP
ncbi:GbsR/MarR family transcriptional regulator [Labedaea rhizosphaerae]|uniref:MarR family protein n=1 Tax=Labedaea rhizosphaerae TaxID=598644 RepID=A0A4R6RXQ6_LABRH|nr:helix-turn-helix domain-containing protein [Labedaea rhizosphaerae]TDP91861.1 MarR family protein [Labedaea rhizosphaerae]